MEVAAPRPHFVICNHPIDAGGVTLSIKGLEGINRASKERGVSLKVVQGDFVHKECRQRYTHPTYIAKSLRREEGESSKKTLPSHGESTFNFKKTASFAGQR